MAKEIQTQEPDNNVSAPGADIPSWVQSALTEIGVMMDTKRVIGEPIQVGDATIVPLFNMGFGFGAATGSGGGKGKAQTGAGFGGALGGGGGVRPAGVLVIDPKGVRFVAPPTKTSGFEQLASSVSTLLERKLPAAERSKPNGEKSDGEKPDEG